jgi:hypothetical protein
MLRGILLLILVPLLVISIAGNVLLFRQGQTTSEEALHLRQRAVEAEQALNSRGSLTSAPSSAAPAQASPPLVPVPEPTPGSGLLGPALVQQILSQVQTLRGLRSTADVPIQFLDEPALRDILLGRFERDYLPSERDVDQKLLVTLGLLRPDQDLVRIDRDLLAEQVLGLYSPDDKKLYVLGSAAQIGPAQEATIAGAYIHALQDQAYDLNRITPMHTDNNDRALAIQALVEGDAMLVQSLWTQRYLSAVQQRELAPDQASLDRLQQMPAVVRTNSLFPYVDGLGFAMQLYRQRGFAGVDAAFANLPASTSQILHPDTYLAGQQPIDVALPDLAARLGAPWRRLDSNVLGELGVRNLLAQYGDRETAQVTAAGWRGDRWQLLDRDGKQALVLRTVWGSDAQASRFFLALGQGFKVRFPDAQAEEKSASRQALTTSSVATDLRRAGRQVDAVISFDRASANALAALGY